MARQITPAPVSTSDRIPPHSEEAERGVLGSILLDAQRVMELCLDQRLTPEAFFVRAHQILFEVLLEMSHEAKPVDLITIGNRLRDLGRLDEIGGTSFLDRLVDSTPTSAHAEYYIELVVQKHLLRSIIDRSRSAIDNCYGSSEEDALTVLDKTEQSFFDIADFRRTALVPWSKLVKDAMQEVERICQEHRTYQGVPSGYLEMDRILQGFKSGDMVVLAARPSMGKTALALNIAENVALGRVPDKMPRAVGVFSLEMPSEQLVRRLLCSHARVPSQKLSGGGYLSQEQHGNLVSAADLLMKAPIYLDDTAGLEALELRSRARRMKRRYDIQMVIVDYLQMLSFPKASRDGRQQEVSAISGAMKAMAKELKIPVLVLSQLSRAPEMREKTARPRLSDLRESGSIEQDADVVMMIRRPSKYQEDDRFDDKTLAVIQVEKNRNGPTGEFDMNFFDEIVRFEDRKSTGVDREPEHGESGF